MQTGEVPSMSTNSTTILFDDLKAQFEAQCAAETASTRKLEQAMEDPRATTRELKAAASDLHASISNLKASTTRMAKAMENFAKRVRNRTNLLCRGLIHQFTRRSPLVETRPVNAAKQLATRRLRESRDFRLTRQGMRRVELERVGYRKVLQQPAEEETDCKFHWSLVKDLDFGLNGEKLKMIKKFWSS